ncbi:hypothetical protein RUM44_003170 [Polyplax serrata]|uniref:Uncharacterized protein n=1 Tax=Polyplax serrata TaxID=468196 RepID=A0ABR1AXR2_POLSC
MIHETGRPSTSMLLPSDEVSVQMSPFSEDRWEADRIENQRRREIHRSYVYTRQVPVEIDRPTVKEDVREEKPAETSHVTQEVPLSVTTQPEIISDPEMAQQYESVQHRRGSIYERKTFKDIKFESPGPVNLYPLLRCPNTRTRKESPYSATASENWYGTQRTEQYELPPKPQFAIYKNILPERAQVQHYGIHVPFWQF